MAKKEEEGKIKTNGRPFILSPEEIESVRSWIDDHEIPPKIGELRLYLLNKLEKDLSYNQLSLLLDKMNYDLKIAVPMEDERFFCDNKKVDMFYDDLYMFTLANNIPSAFIFNLDEEGNEEFADAKNEKLIVKKGSNGTYHYPVSRKQDHATLLACIVANGTFLKPLFCCYKVYSRIFIIVAQYWT